MTVTVEDVELVGSDPDATYKVTAYRPDGGRRRYRGLDAQAVGNLVADIRAANPDWRVYVEPTGTRRGASPGEPAYGWPHDAVSALSLGAPARRACVGVAAAGTRGDP